MDTAPPAPAPVPLQRTRGRAQVAMQRRNGTTRLARLHQSGAAKVLWPRVEGPVPEAVLLNTAGGLTGGDRLAFGIGLDADTALTATTQAAERVYRARDGVAEVANRATLGERARLRWLPQETILFDGCALSRRLDVEMPSSATLLALEALVLGRSAMGETLTRGRIDDQWRIRRDGRLVHAEAFRAEGDLSVLRRGAATLAGTAALATLVLVAPDAEARRDPVRAALTGLAAVTAAASARNGILVLRLRAPAASALRPALLCALAALGAGLAPRVWIP